MKEVAEQLWRHEQKWCWLIALSSSVITHGFSIFRSHFMRRQEYTLNPNLFEDWFCHKSNYNTASSVLLISVWVIYWIPKPIQTHQLSRLHCVVKKSVSACLRGGNKAQTSQLLPFLCSHYSFHYCCFYEWCFSEYYLTSKLLLARRRICPCKPSTQSC